jgi:hypothetical protein
MKKWLVMVMFLTLKFADYRDILEDVLQLRFGQRVSAV